MSLPSLIALCSKVDGMLQRIRHERHIVPPIIRCRKCGITGRAAEPRVSVRAVILAAARFDIASPTAVKRLEKEWAKYRVQDGLDLYPKRFESFTVGKFSLRSCPESLGWLQPRGKRSVHYAGCCACNQADENTD